MYFCLLLLFTSVPEVTVLVQKIELNNNQLHSFT